MSTSPSPTRGRRSAPLLALAALLVAGSLPAQEPTPTPPPAPAAEPTLQEQIEQLRQQLLVEAERAKTGATVTASAKDGFSLRSNDGYFTLRLRGYVHADGRFYGSETTTADTFLLRRVRPIFEGTVGKRFGLRLMPDFGNGTTALQDAWVDWTFSDAAVLRVGKVKPPVGLERLQSATDMTFAERALPTALVPNRDVGIQLAGQLVGGRLEYQAGLFNGVVDGGSADSDVNDGKDAAARLWATPWKDTTGPLAGLSFGVAATLGDQQGTATAPALPAIRTAGQQTFFSYRTNTPATLAGTAIADGDRFRLAPQLVWFDGPVGVMGEYVTSAQEVRLGATVEELENRAWQVTGVWVLSGENASFRWFTPRQGFDRTHEDETRRGWGGFALKARYNEFRADPDAFPTFAASSAVQEAAGWALGFDWTLHKMTRLLVDYEVTSFDGLGIEREDEEVLFTRLQIGW
jgi:phosphate-selective porin OprO/OprP